MSANKWFVRPHVNKEYGDPDCCKLAIFDSDDEEGLQIATVMSDAGLPCEKHANLIAAAPELLEALLPIAERGEISAKIIANAQAAIAKARGKS